MYLNVRIIAFVDLCVSVVFWLQVIPDKIVDDLFTVCRTDSHEKLETFVKVG